jgi:hypothetical protein
LYSKFFFEINDKYIKLASRLIKNLPIPLDTLIRKRVRLKLVLLLILYVIVLQFFFEINNKYIKLASRLIKNLLIPLDTLIRKRVRLKLVLLLILYVILVKFKLHSHQQLWNGECSSRSAGAGCARVSFSHTRISWPAGRSCGARSGSP